MLGVSLGGIIAQRLAVDHPSRVDRLVLVSCAERFTPYLSQMAALLGAVLAGFRGTCSCARSSFWEPAHNTLMST